MTCRWKFYVRAARFRCRSFSRIERGGVPFRRSQGAAAWKIRTLIAYPRWYRGPSGSSRHRPAAPGSPGLHAELMPLRLTGGHMRAKRPLALTMIVFVSLSAVASWAADDTVVPRAGPNAAPPNTAPAAAAPKDGVPPPSVTIIGAADAHGVLGRDVRSAADEDMGRIVDVVVDRAGQVRAAVIDFGGFLGVGSRKIVVDWNALRFWRIGNKSDSISLELNVTVVGGRSILKTLRRRRRSRLLIRRRRRRRARACADLTGSSSFSRMCRPASVLSSRCT